jgi:hypothetical protein
MLETAMVIEIQPRVSTPSPRIGPICVLPALRRIRRAALAMTSRRDRITERRKSHKRCRPVRANSVDPGLRTQMVTCTLGAPAVLRTSPSTITATNSPGLSNNSHTPQSRILPPQRLHHHSVNHRPLNKSTPSQAKHYPISF